MHYTVSLKSAEKPTRTRSRCQDDRFQARFSGLYLADVPANARVAFLFQDASCTDPTFEPHQQQLGRSGLTRLHRVLPAVRHAQLADLLSRHPLGLRSQCRTQIGWFPEPLSIAATLVAVTGQGTSSPTVGAVLLAGVPAERDLPGSAGPVRPDDDGAVRRRHEQLADRQWPVASGGDIDCDTTRGRQRHLLVRGAVREPGDERPVAGTASAAFQLAVTDLVQFEAGVMYFSPPVDGGLVGALNYPSFGGAGGSTNPFGFNVTLDVLGPVDPLRSFFQFTDPLLGSNFVTANGKPFALKTVNTGDIGTASRFVFAGRPQSWSRARATYLRPGRTIRPGARLRRSECRRGGHTDSAKMLCGVTGTEFLTVTLGATPDMLEFVPAKPASASRRPRTRRPIPPISTPPRRLVVQLVAPEGTTSPQPERAPLYNRRTRRPPCLPAPRPPPASPFMSSTISRWRHGAPRHRETPRRCRWCPMPDWISRRIRISIRPATGIWNRGRSIPSAPICS